MLYFMFDIFMFLYYGGAAIAGAFFLVSLCRFLWGKWQNKEQPGSVSEESMKSRKRLLIISLVCVGVIAAFMIAMMLILLQALMHM